MYVIQDDREIKVVCILVFHFYFNKQVPRVNILLQCLITDCVTISVPIILTTQYSLRDLNYF